MCKSVDKKQYAWVVFVLVPIHNNEKVMEKVDKDNDRNTTF